MQLAGGAEVTCILAQSRWPVSDETVSSLMIYEDAYVVCVQIKSAHLSSVDCLIHKRLYSTTDSIFTEVQIAVYTILVIWLLRLINLFESDVSFLLCNRGVGVHSWQIYFGQGLKCAVLTLFHM